MTREFNLFINGAYTASANQDRFDNFNRCTQTPWSSIARAREDQVHDAVASARAAFSKWSRSSGRSRVEMLFRRADLLEANANRFALMEITYREADQ